MDNVRWGPDRMLLVAGQGEPGGAVTGGGSAGNLSMSIVGRIDPETMTYTAIVNQPTNDSARRRSQSRSATRSGQGRSAAIESLVTRRRVRGVSPRQTNRTPGPNHQLPKHWELAQGRAKMPHSVLPQNW